MNLSDEQTRQLLQRAKKLAKFLEKGWPRTAEVNPVDLSFFTEVEKPVGVAETVEVKSENAFSNGQRYAFDQVVGLVKRHGLNPDTKVRVQDVVREIKRLRDEVGDV
jgi:hypothetical protein